MLIDSPTSVLSETLDKRAPLATVGGLVAGIAAAAETALSVLDAARFAYLTDIWMVCTAAGTTAGTFTIRSSVGGTSVFFIPQPYPTVAIGTAIDMHFDQPWKTPFINRAFSIQPSVATMGTWSVLVGGFYSSV